jgi:hypothetical protein
MKRLLLTSAAGLLLTSLSTFAQSLSDRLVIKQADGAQTIYGITELNEVSAGPGYAWYLGNSALADPAMYGRATALTEPGQPNWISDIFGVIDIAGIKYLAFSSDSETFDASGAASQYGGISQSLTETAGAYNMTMYLAPNLRAAGWTAEFSSDVEATVPDAGATASLLGLGLLGLGGLRRKLAA